MTSETFVSNEQIVMAARRRLAQGRWDYLVGGSESETTMRRNRQAFDRWAFRPRTLVDVSHTNTSTTFLAQNLRIPALPSPLRRFVHHWRTHHAALTALQVSTTT